ncbi:MAG: hypothetical protein ABIH20_04385 [Candidatus Diapherotrites archaeon]
MLIAEKDFNVLMENYSLKFDEVILKQLKQLEKEKDLKERISKMLDKIEKLGPNAGKLIDSNLLLYEIKAKKPPIRLYYEIEEKQKKAYIFEYEIKTSKKKQQKTIRKIKKKSET